MSLPPFPPSSPKPNTAAIAGGVVGAIAVVAIALVIVFICMRRRRKITQGQVAYQPTATSEPFAYSGQMMGQAAAPMNAASPPMPSANYGQAASLVNNASPLMPAANFSPHPSGSCELIALHALSIMRSISVQIGHLPRL